MYVSWGTIESWGVGGDELRNLRSQFGEDGIPVETGSLVALAETYGEDLATYLPRLFKTPQACQRFVSRFSRQWPQIKARLDNGDAVTGLINAAKENPASQPLDFAQANVANILRTAVSYGGDSRTAVELVGAAFNESVLLETSI